MRGGGRTELELEMRSSLGKRFCAPCLSTNWRLSNVQLLTVTAGLFAVFVVAELIGGYISNSLALMGDAAAMSIDVMTYIVNIYAEVLKARGEKLTAFQRKVMSVVVPSFSLVMLWVVTGFLAAEALNMIQQGGSQSEDEEVPLIYMFGFATGNLLVDVVSGVLFLCRGRSSLVDHCDDSSVGTARFSGHDHSHFHFHAPGEGGSKVIAQTELVKTPIAHHDHSHIHINEPPKSCSSGGCGAKNCCKSKSMPTEVTHSHNHSHIHENQRPAPADSCTRGVMAVNLNMLSAITHVGGDTLRSISVLLAASISYFRGIDGALCDAWAALIVTVTIGLASVPLIANLCYTISHVNRDPCEGCQCPVAEDGLSTPPDVESQGLLSGTTNDSSYGSVN